jgi:germination protein M
VKRKLLCLLLCLALLPTAGCAYVTAQETESADCYDLYFAVRDLNSADGGDAVAAEKSNVEKDDDRNTQALATALLTQLFSGPSEESLISPFPAGTQLLSITLDGPRAVVDLTPSYSTLSGVSLTMADYCIALTLTQLSDIATVSVTVRGKNLVYRDSQNFSADDILLSSTEDVVGTVTVTLYFLDSRGTMTPEERTLELYEGDTQAGAVVQAMEKGPENRDLSASLPEGFTVQSVWMEDDTCYVNLPSSALQVIPQDADLQMAIYALTRSLRTLDMVNSVQILVDGEFTGSYGGVDVGRPFGG